MYLSVVYIIIDVDHEAQLGIIVFFVLVNAVLLNNCIRFFFLIKLYTGDLFIFYFFERVLTYDGCF